MSAADFIT